MDNNADHISPTRQRWSGVLAVELVAVLAHRPETAAKPALLHHLHRQALQAEHKQGVICRQYWRIVAPEILHNIDLGRLGPQQV